MDPKVHMYESLGDHIILVSGVKHICLIVEGGKIEFFVVFNSMELTCRIIILVLYVISNIKIGLEV